jgi:hypothetical protein
MHLEAACPNKEGFCWWSLLIIILSVMKLEVEMILIARPISLTKCRTLQFPGDVVRARYNEI